MQMVYVYGTLAFVEEVRISFHVTFGDLPQLVFCFMKLFDVCPHRILYWPPDDEKRNVIDKFGCCRK